MEAESKQVENVDVDVDVSVNVITGPSAFSVIPPASLLLLSSPEVGDCLDSGFIAWLYGIAQRQRGCSCASFGTLRRQLATNARAACSLSRWCSWSRVSACEREEA